jgi:hypothetical protein
LSGFADIEPTWPKTESVARRLNFRSPESRQLAATYRVVRVEKLAPASVAYGFRMPGRVDDIGQKHCREDALVAHRRPYARKKFDDLVCELIGVVAKKKGMWSIPGNSNSRAFGMPLANCRPPSTFTTVSLVR